MCFPLSMYMYYLVCLYSVVHLIRIYKSTQIIWIKGKFELQQHPLNSNFAHMNNNFELKG